MKMTKFPQVLFQFSKKIEENLAENVSLHFHPAQQKKSGSARSLFTKRQHAATHLFLCFATLQGKNIFLRYFW